MITAGRTDGEHRREFARGWGGCNQPGRTPLTYDHPSAAIPAFVPSSNDLDGDGSPDTFHTALSFKGGPGLIGPERILFRAAVASWLDAANEGVGFPLRRQDFVPEVNAARQWRPPDDDRLRRIRRRTEQPRLPPELSSADEAARRRSGRPLCDP
jgi:hypothetical protein